jgi:hypothetical protein
MMRCPRCNKRIKRKQWKRDHCCFKCEYNMCWAAENDPIYRYFFRTNKYIVYVEKSRSQIYYKKSNQNFFTHTAPDGTRLYRSDEGQFICYLSKQISPKSTDEDIDKLLALR